MEVAFLFFPCDSGGNGYCSDAERVCGCGVGDVCVLPQKKSSDFERTSKVVSERIVGKYNRGVVARCITIRVSRVRRLPTYPENGSSRRFYRNGEGNNRKTRIWGCLRMRKTQASREGIFNCSYIL
ncbi:unnamed protein product [Ixodes pacificus]